MSNTTREVISARAAVVATTLDYFNGWFDGESVRNCDFASDTFTRGPSSPFRDAFYMDDAIYELHRVLHPGLAKRSLRQVDADSDELRTVTKEQMVAWTDEGEGKREDPGGDRGIDVEVIDVYGNIASVVVRSSVYREYLHLVRSDDGWRIANALWHFT